MCRRRAMVLSSPARRRSSWRRATRYGGGRSSVPLTCCSFASCGTTGAPAASTSWTRPEGAPSVGLALPPSQCLGLIALSADGKRELEALADWWSARTRGETPDVVMLDADTNVSDALARFLAGGLLRNALAASRTIVQLRRDLAELREEHETTHTILTMLGRAVSRWQVPPLSCELVLHPGSSALGPTRDGEAFGLRQRLPIPSQGLAAIALHMVKGTAVASGRLLVALNARESGVNLVTWGVPDKPSLEVSSTTSRKATAESRL